MGKSLNRSDFCREIGAGEGNRTLVFSLEGCCSTIELHPRCPITYHAASPPSTALRQCRRIVSKPRSRPLTCCDSAPILTFPPTTKGGDPVSYSKRCHLAGIA